MKTIHYLDYCTYAMLNQLAPDAYRSLWYSVQHDDECLLQETDIIVFEGWRTVEEDGTYGPHNVGKVCSYVLIPDYPVSMSEIMSMVFAAILVSAQTYGAKHFITPQMLMLYGLTNNTNLKFLMEGAK